jgi:hypothetical protein
MVYMYFMSRNLEFGIEAAERRTTLSISGPRGPLRKAGRDRHLVKPADKRKVFRYFETKAGTKANQGIGEVDINARKVGGTAHKGIKQATLRGIMDYLYFLGSGQADWLDPDPRLQVYEGMVDSDATGTLAAVVNSPPEVKDPKVLERLVLEGMRGMAKDLRYSRGTASSGRQIERNLSRTLSASIRPEEGVDLSADDINGARLSTGEDYDPRSGLINLYAHDLRTPAQQLICFSGIVGIAQAGRQLAKA